jgi:hypothetical protein
MTTATMTRTVELTPEMMYDIVVEAKTAARHAASKYFAEVMDNVDAGCCGFAWVNIYTVDGKKIRANSKIGKALQASGVGKDWTGAWQLWNPSNFPCQNIDTLEVGAMAAADVFKQYGFEAYAGSRLD